MTEVYVVTREGVYRHEILGIYLSVEDACIAAKIASGAEPDSWHSIKVGRGAVGIPIDDVALVQTYKKGANHV